MKKATKNTEIKKKPGILVQKAQAKRTSTKIAVVLPSKTTGFAPIPNKS